MITNAVEFDAKIDADWNQHTYRVSEKFIIFSESNLAVKER